MPIKRRLAKGRRSNRPRKHRSWQVQEAKAKFSQLLNETLAEGYQTITKNGKPVAYMISKQEFDRHVQPKASFLDALEQCPYPNVDFELERSKDSIRDFE